MELVNCWGWIRCLTMLIFVYLLPKQVFADLCSNIQIGTCDCQEMSEQLEIDCSYRDLKAYPDIDKMHQVIWNKLYLSNRDVNTDQI